MYQWSKEPDARDLYYHKFCYPFTTLGILSFSSIAVARRFRTSNWDEIRRQAEICLIR